ASITGSPKCLRGDYPDLCVDEVQGLRLSRQLPNILTQRQFINDTKMVYTNVDGSMIKGPFQDIKKDKGDHMSPSPQQYQQQQSPRKNDKYGSWGPIFKNKENFIDMHIC
ncbi:hypothetical protein X777_15874, partial [Ooceraea biroi]